MRSEVVFMDEPDEAKVVVWKDSLTEDWGIHLEFVKRGRDPEKLSIRISMQNAELAKLAHLIESTIKGSRPTIADEPVDQEGLPRP